MGKEAQEKIAIEKAMTNGKHLFFLMTSGIQFVDTRTVAELIHRIIHQLGYQKLPEGEMPLVGNPYCDDPNSPDYQDLDIYCNSAFARGAKAQRELYIKWLGGE